jgi:hypothetical protein
MYMFNVVYISGYYLSEQGHGGSVVIFRRETFRETLIFVILKIFAPRRDIASPTTKAGLLLLSGEIIPVYRGSPIVP